jgi:hypothetical protein
VALEQADGFQVVLPLLSVYALLFSSGMSWVCHNNPHHLVVNGTGHA